ncbi:MAG: hypothetical protein N2319_00035 [Candidatus Kapabacteria bacterium]|nr:hypothetical protein [Candidatus Kapabacteria bacterium]
MEFNETAEVKFEFSFNNEYSDERGFEYPTKIPVIKPKDRFKPICNCDAEAVTLFFGWNSPFKETQIHLERKGNIFQGDLEVLSDAPNGKYKYFVAIFKNGKIIIDDPEVIIRRNY